MEWMVLIEMLIKIFGPILVKWLEEWLNDRLKMAAENLPAASTYGSKGEATTALFDEAIRSLWFAPIRKALLRRMKATAVKNGEVITSLSPEDADELRGLATIARNE